MVRAISIYWLVVPWLCCVSLAQGADISVPDLYLSREAWQKMNWGAAEASTLWQAPGWHSFTGKQAETYSLVHERSLAVLGHQMVARLGRKNDAPQHFATLTADLTRADCERLAKSFTTVFGSPRFRDGTTAWYFSPQDYVRLLHHDYEWDVGGTRIHAGCFGTISSNDEPREAKKLTWSAHYASTEFAPPLTPSFAIRCSRTAHFASGGPSRGLDDLVAWVDVDGKAVKNANYSAISDSDSLVATDSQITFKVTREKFITEYAINRITGSLSANIFRDGTVPFGEVRGRCEKMDRIERQF